MPRASLSASSSEAHRRSGGARADGMCRREDAARTRRGPRHVCAHSCTCRAAARDARAPACTRSNAGDARRGNPPPRGPRSRGSHFLPCAARSAWSRDWARRPGMEPIGGDSASRPTPRGRFASREGETSSRVTDKHECARRTKPWRRHLTRHIVRCRTACFRLGFSPLGLARSCRWDLDGTRRSYSTRARQSPTTSAPSFLDDSAAYIVCNEAVLGTGSALQGRAEEINLLGAHLGFEKRRKLENARRALTQYHPTSR